MVGFAKVDEALGNHDGSGMESVPPRGRGWVRSREIQPQIYADNTQIRAKLP